MSHVLERTLPPISIGGIGMTLSGELEQVRTNPQRGVFRDELTEVDIEIDVQWRDRLPDRGAEALFVPDGVWRLTDRAPDYVFEFSTPFFPSTPYKRLYAQPDFRKARIVLNRKALADFCPVDPLEYPADELLFTNYLAVHGLGVEVHGCGLIDPECGGLLFLGHSGAGKSTTTRIWDAARNPAILSDDRIILRIHDGELWMYGTPWHGEAAFALPEKSRLKRILILQHGRCNEIRNLSRAQALGEIFARCFPPFHSPVGLERTLEFLNRVVDTVPCYEFFFVPNETAVEAILRLQ